MGKEEVVKENVQVKQKRKVTEIVVNVIMVFAILFAIGCSFTAFVMKSGDGVPSFFGIRPFAIQSDSMLPTFAKGDLVIDKIVEPKDLKVDDIITFWAVIDGEKVLNTHRIVEITDNETFLFFTTKGDNNSSEDAIGVHQSEIVGKYQFKIDGVGKLIDFLQTSKGFLIVIVIPVFIFFVYHLIQFFKVLFAYQAEKVKAQMNEEGKSKEDTK